MCTGATVIMSEGCSLEGLGDGLDLSVRGLLGTRSSLEDGVVDVDFRVHNLALLKLDERVGHRVVDSGVVALVLADDDGHVAHRGSGGHVPVIDGQLRSRHILDLSLIDVVQELSVSLVGLLLEVADETVASLGEQEVGGQIASEEHSLDRDDQQALAPSRAQDLQPAEQVDSLVLSLVKERADPVIVLYLTQGSQMVHHSRDHTRDGSDGFEHHSAIDKVVSEVGIRANAEEAHDLVGDGIRHSLSIAVSNGVLSAENLQQFGGGVGVAGGGTMVLGGWESLGDIIEFLVGISTRQGACRLVDRTSSAALGLGGRGRGRLAHARRAERDCVSKTSSQHSVVMCYQGMSMTGISELRGKCR